MLMGISESARIFLAELWEFYPANKNRVSNILVDSSGGIDNRWSLMSAVTPDGALRVVQITPVSGTMFMSAFNPVGGLSDVYSIRVWNLIRDFGGSTNFEGIYAPYRCTWTVERGDFVVPSDAVIYNQTQGWISKNAGQTASVKVTVHCDIGTWHNGVNGNVDDIKYYVAFLYTWAYKDNANDTYFDQNLGSVRYALDSVLGFQWTDDGYVVYGTYKHPLADDLTAKNYVDYFYPQMPWELYWAMGELVARSKDYGIDKTYSFSSSGEGVLWLDLLNGTHTSDLAAIMDAISVGNVVKTFPGINWTAMVSRINADLQFYNERGHLVISNGPYLLAAYSPDSLYLKLEKFDGSRAVYTDTLPRDGNSSVIEFYGTQDVNGAVLNISQGAYDVGLFRFTKSWYSNFGTDVLANLNLYKSASSYNELTFNTWHDPDKDAPIVTVGDKVYFNPFAVREVRFAMNYLLSREYIVQNIYQGSGAPMLGCIRPSHPANKYFEPVYRILGLTQEGNLQYAISIVDSAMAGAAQQVAKYGHTLEKGTDGYWYFDGQPVTVKFIIRIEDERKEIGLYVADLIEKYLGFKVDRLLWDRIQASSVVFANPPSNYEWNIYTGEWGASGISSVWIDDYTAWFYAAWYGYVPGSVEPKHVNTVTVGEVLNYIGLQYGDIGSYDDAVQNASAVYFVFNNLGTPDAFSTAQYVSRTIPLATRTVSRSVDEFNMSTVTANDVVVSVGGPLVNSITAKYDNIALVHMAIDGRTITIVSPQGNFTWTAPTPWWNVTEGYFVIQLFNDRTTGALVVTIYGTDADSTAAGAYYFLTQIYPNINSYSGTNYLVGLWQDTEYGSDIPLPGSSLGDDSGFSAGDTITIVAQG
ncbi:peptide ABC transporter permease [Thermococcus sp. GR7]|nr:peptide ABC transporter permease [Thermococcus sp. GR7]NJE78460.1 peptide ABC transporter permease [Thermococcus sp. GR4]NJF22163.1 peptide ABC transporter permease [Thermococcus sp. GR5]